MYRVKSLPNWEIPSHVHDQNKNSYPKIVPVKFLQNLLNSDRQNVGIRYGVNTICPSLGGGQ